MERLILHGEVIELEERTCSGGCGMKFKVMPNSPITRARKRCEQYCKGHSMSHDELKQEHWAGHCPYKDPNGIYYGYD